MMVAATCFSPAAAAVPVVQKRDRMDRYCLYVYIFT